MSRARHFIRNISSGYLLLLANMVYVVVSVPLALRYLTREQFGLWELMFDITSYLTLIDLGTTPSVSRLLIDHKDRPNDGEYGGLIQTGGLVLVCQGLIILVVGLLGSPAASQLLRIPPPLKVSFVRLLRWQCTIMAAGYITRVFAQVLYAHQLIDGLNLVQVGLTGLSLVVLWAGFHFGAGVYSVLWANATVSLLLALAQVGFCLRLGRLLPEKGCWGRPSWEKFKALFQYGKDVFQVAVGRQLTMASQTLVISRTLGLGAVAAWSVGTRAFNLLCQLIWRIFDFSEPVFSEMVVRGEWDRLRDRFRSITMVSASLAGAAAVVFALCNAAFVQVWTAGKITWPMRCDLLLGVWLIVLVLGRCHGAMVFVSKKIGLMRSIYFIEGVVFLCLAFLVASRGGLPAILAVSILCSISFSGACGLRHTVTFLHFTPKEILWDWLWPMARIILVVTPAVLVIGWVLWPLATLARLVIAGTLAGAVAAGALVRFGVPDDLKAEALRQGPEWVSRLLRRLFGAA